MTKSGRLLKALIFAFLINAFPSPFSPPGLCQESEAGIRLEAGAGYGFAHFNGRYGDDFVFRPDLHYPYAAIGYETGNGLGFYLRFTYARGEATTNDFPGDWDWYHGDLALDFRWTFMRDSPVRPFVMVGAPFFYWLSIKSDEGDYVSMVGLYFFDDKEDMAALDLGGGCGYYFGKDGRLAVNAVLLYHFAVYDMLALEFSNMESHSYTNTWGGVGAAYLTLSYTFF